MRELVVRQCEILKLVLLVPRQNQCKRAIKKDWHPNLLGRCDKTDAYGLRKLFKQAGVKVALRPRGPGQHGHNARLYRASECAIYALNCDANEATARVLQIGFNGTDGDPKTDTDPGNVLREKMDGDMS
jgi:hypothetical protein